MNTTEPKQAKHTPGPWTWDEGWGRIVADGEHITPTWPNTTEQPAREQQLANARLIAAAPDLLAAVKGLLDCPDLNLDELDDVTIEAIDDARAAIAKATA